MSNVVSSKFGDRKLIQLPPVNFGGTRSAVVPTLAPRDYAGERTGRGDYTDRSTSSYNSGIAQTKDIGSSWMGPPRRPYTDGNIVKETYRPDVQQFNMVEPIVGPNGPYLQYTPQALGLPTQQQYGPQPQGQAPQAASGMQPDHGRQVAPNQGQPASNPAPADITSNQPAPACNAQGCSSNPNEKHIYYGPNGERLPGPPAGFPAPGSRPSTEIYQRDFVVDAVLEFGRVKTVTNLDYSVQFPKLPDYLLRHLQRKYGQFERTDARIACRKGEFHVHGVPQMPGPRWRDFALPPPFEHLTEPKQYRTPAVMERSYPFEDDRGYSRYDVSRTAIEDPIRDIRWHRATTIDDS